MPRAVRRTAALHPATDTVRSAGPAGVGAIAAADARDAPRRAGSAPVNGVARPPGATDAGPGVVRLSQDVLDPDEAGGDSLDSAGRDDAGVHPDLVPMERNVSGRHQRLHAKCLAMPVRVGEQRPGGGEVDGLPVETGGAGPFELVAAAVPAPPGAGARARLGRPVWRG